MSIGQKVCKKSYEYHDYYENGRESSKKKGKFTESRETEESVAGPIFHGVRIPVCPKPL